MEFTVISEVKAVKNSVFARVGNEYICQHYGTEILKAVPITEQEKKTLNNLNAKAIHPTLKIVTLNRASTTSSKMINRCLEYLNHPTPKKAFEQEIF